MTIQFADLAKTSFSEVRVRSRRKHDARIAAICIEHGVHEFWSADRDFNRFPCPTVRNPLVG